MLNQDLKLDFNQILSENPVADLDVLARQYNISVTEFLAILPYNEAAKTDGQNFATVMEEVSNWGDVVLIVRNQDVVGEIGGSLPKGEFGQGYYNFHAPDGRSGGHIKADACKEIYFVSRPLFGKESHSIHFYNQTGQGMFKIYLGRDEQGSPRRDQHEKYLQLRDRLCDNQKS